MDSNTQEQRLRDHFVVLESVRKGKILEIQNLLLERQRETKRLESLEKMWLELSKFDISAWMLEEKIRADQDEVSESNDLYRKKVERIDAAHALQIDSFRPYVWAGFGFMLAAVAFLS